MKNLIMFVLLIGFISMAPFGEPRHYETLRPITAMLSPAFNPAILVPFHGTFKSLDMLSFAPETKQRAEWEFQAGAFPVDTINYDIYWMPIDGSVGKVRWNITQSDIGFGGNYDFPGLMGFSHITTTIGAPFIVYRTRIIILNVVKKRSTVHVILERDGPHFHDNYPLDVLLIGVLVYL